jgi:hypothetical protein
VAGDANSGKIIIILTRSLNVTEILSGVTITVLAACDIFMALGCA